MRGRFRPSSIAVWLPGLVLVYGALLIYWTHMLEPGAALWAAIGITTLLAAGASYRAVAEVQDRITTSDAALWENEARYRTVLETAPYAIITTDATGNMLAFNRAAEKMFGYSAPEVLGQSISMLMPARYRGQHEQYVAASQGLRNMIVIGRDREVEGLRKDGGAFPIEINLSEVHLGGHKHFTAVIKDISARKQAELALKRQRDLYSALSEINQMIVREQESAQFFQRACGILVRYAGFLRACIQQYDATSEQLVHVASAGLSWPEVETPEPITPETLDSPLAMAYIETRAMVLGDLSAVTRPSVWIEAARRAGVFGCASFPIRRSGKSYAILKTYAGAAGFFEPDIVRLLEEVALDLSFALDNYDREAARQQVEAALRESEARFRHVADTAPVMIWMSESDHHTTYFNKRWLEFTGHTLEEELGYDRTADVHPDDLEQCLETYRRHFDARQPYTLEYRHRRRDGEFRWILDSGVPRYNASGKFLGYIGSCVDVTERKEREEALRLAAATFETEEGIIITDRQGTILRANQAFTKITGYSQEELIGKNPRILQSGWQDAAFYRRFWQALTTKGRWQGEIWNKRKNGEIYPEWLSVTAVRDETGAITHYVATLADITLQKQAEARIERLAFYDELTQLPNRRLLMNRVDQCQALAARSGFIGALMFIDLDNFKHINDALGHAVGDMLLKEVATRLTMHLRLEDTVARLGGDEFIVVLANMGPLPSVAATQARVVADKIRVSLNEPYKPMGHVLHISPSIGITLFPEDRTGADDLLKQADTAMYRAKADGRDCVRFYEPGMQAAAEARLIMEKDLRAGLTGSSLFPLYQPQVDAGGRIVGAEALLRWRHPEKGFIPPQEFIPIAEDTGLIVPIGERMLTDACRHARELASTPGNGLLRIAVNVSARQFHHPDFVERVTAIVNQAGADPDFLTIELTEGMVTRDVADTIQKMEALKKLGVRFSLDDFGTGYSSLAYLKRLPLDEIKIDRSFVQDLPYDASDLALVETILSVARHLKLGVVAEGVETAEQWQFLKKRGCSLFQGYYFSRPVPFADYVELLNRGEISPQAG